jgi:hypothetical protein
MMSRIQSALQVLAIALGLLIYSMIVHKSYTDISALAQKHSGGEFRRALLKYFIGNLAGGGGKPAASSGEKE